MNKEKAIGQYKMKRRKFGARLELIKKKFGPLKGKKILDLGCGNGETTLLVGFEDADIIGFDKRTGWLKDKNVGALTDLKKMGNFFEEEPSFVVGLAEEIPFKPNSFDLVILNDVLDHVKDDRAVLKIVHSILKRDGSVFIALPNRRQLIEHHFGEITRIPFFGFFPRKVQDRLLEFGMKNGGGLYRLYDRGDLRELTNGFFKEESIGYEMLFFDKLSRRNQYTGSFFRKILQFLGKTPLRIFGPHILFLGKRIPYS